LPAIEAAHVVAGAATLLVKVRASTTKELQNVLRELHSISGVSGTESIIVLETTFERAVNVSEA
jgi:Lrp/AsnC family transcriptional regulator, leucine-responsive regulatory protein